MNKSSFVFLLLLLCCSATTKADDGYRLWLRYEPVTDNRLLQQYRHALSFLQFNTTGAVLPAAKEELIRGIKGLLGTDMPETQAPNNQLPEGCLAVGTPASSPIVASMHWEKDLAGLGEEGFLIRSVITTSGRKATLIAANTDRGILYGTFQFLRLLQTRRSLQGLSINHHPAMPYRVLDHWDNLDRKVERGYAGFSIFDWFTLPLYMDPRYTDYARANASIGINGTVLNNVNASPLILTKDYLGKVAALADLFRSYGIRVYLSVRFSSPIEIGRLKTADPLDPAVQQWWRDKADEIYRLIPDFGGFLVKANSEGQPGPQNYGRNHAQGANLLADALAPHNGIVIWRAFVYNETPEDRARQAYSEFKPLDGQFHKNVLVQVKNGPIDFQPREPFHPLFGAMPATSLMMEFQLTQEYLGFSTHLVFLAPLFKECLDADTYTKGKGSPVSETITGMAGVANIGNDINWCGHPFAQSNWYAFGRLAWDPSLSSAEIAEEWIRQTFGNEPAVLAPLQKMMLSSREITVDYMTPLGLHHIMGYGHHYGPAPWYDKASRADWNPVYFHRSDSAGIGFDRSKTGSNALDQYAPGARTQWEDSTTCPDKWLLWWHHVSWAHRMMSGRTLWEELIHAYYTGVDSVRGMQQTWNTLKGAIDTQRWDEVRMRLVMQEKEAVWWRNACLLYFQTFSRLPLPAGVEQPDHTLDYYKQLQFYYPPGTSATGVAAPARP